jgi:hypothetical protein
MKNPMHCSFCLSPLSDVRLLIAGGTPATICDGCIIAAVGRVAHDDEVVAGVLQTIADRRRQAVSSLASAPASASTNRADLPR